MIIFGDDIKNIMTNNVCTDIEDAMNDSRIRHTIFQIAVI